ncbi:hypothetical protein [Variovorax sp. GT1P44]|uniref:hypothetical protein n=1 Tax=Variovorax sp. GT1P44 TaxID=3443742 RepID=UPI003F44F592
MVTEALVLASLALLIAGAWIFDVLTTRPPTTRMQRLKDRIRQTKAGLRGD